MTFELCLITQPDCLHIKRYLSFIEEAISGGVTLVQFREKASNPAERYQFAKSLKALLDVYHIPLLINDDLELALAIYADGIHLGQSDVHPKEASKKLGKEKYIGLSIETLSQLETANTLDCIHYVAASAVFHSPTKKDCKTIWGLDGLTQICQYSRHPVMAIGGITLENLPFVMAAGACGIATISALHHTANPMQTAQRFLKIIKD